MSAPLDILLRAPSAMHRAGECLAECLAPGDAIALVGDLGAGKTLLVQGIGLGLGVPAAVRITSPTFTLLNEYRGGRLDLFHADLYRIEAESELQHIGFDDALEAGGVFAVEWADRYPRVLSADSLRVAIETPHEGVRRVTAIGGGPRSSALAAAWAERVD